MRFLLTLVLSLAAHAEVDWQGHRGARGLMPENTIGSMKEALRYPVTTLELDVVISKDKKVVVSHEPWMNPVICRHPEGKSYKEKELNLFKMSYDEIKRFDCGSLPHPRFPDQKKVIVGKPTLGALLFEVEGDLKKSGRKVSYNIEIKSDLWQEKNGYQPSVGEFTELVMKEILAHVPLERIILQSFDPRVIRHLHETRPQVTLSFLTEERTTVEGLKKSLGFLPPIWSPFHEVLNPEIVKSFQAEGVKVIPWTVNNTVTMKRLLDLGVDGIITDYPNLIPEVTVKDCPAGTNLFEGSCVKVPAHALPSDSVPGWSCKRGYVQKRSRCEKIKIPSHAELSPDGKGWECKQNYKRYRGRCQKK